MDLGEKLVGLERGLEEALEEVGSRDVARAARPLYDERGVEREQRGRKIGARITVRDGSADGAAVAHLVVAHLGRDRAHYTAFAGEHVVGLHIAVASEGTDGNVIAGVSDVRQVVEPADVHHHRRRREPELHQRQQRHPAREQLGFVAVLGELRERGFGRVDAHVVESGGNHGAVVFIWSAAASTDSTMLW